MLWPTCLRVAAGPAQSDAASIEPGRRGLGRPQLFEQGNIAAVGGRLDEQGNSTQRWDRDQGFGAGQADRAAADGFMPVAAGTGRIAAVVDVNQADLGRAQG